MSTTHPDDGTVGEHPPATPPHGLAALWDRLTAPQRRAVARVLAQRGVTRDINREFADTRTFGERAADRIAAFGGSWPFIGLAFVMLAGWVVLNSVILARRGTAFDPFPYILLNLFLSMLAALQAPVIMMSQNRQAARDRLEAAHDYEVNLKAELEIQALHEKLDALRAHDWAALVEQQHEQIQLLQRLLERATRESA
jgi:uncharacterized membrane protein